MVLNNVERKILALSVEEIAELLRPETGNINVLTRRSNAFKKLGAINLEVAVVQAVKRGELDRIQLRAPRLSSRQKAILKLLAAGTSVVRIEIELNLRANVDYYDELKELYRIFQVNTRPSSC